MFKAFKHAGIQYLAVNRHDGVGIVDADGKNYGSWYSVDSFLDHMKKQQVSPVGRAEISIRAAVGGGSHG